MIKKTCCYVVLFVCSIMVCAQDMEAYNTLYTKTYLETSQKDLPRALHLADSLYIISETPVLQIRSLMLTASLYQRVGETIKAIEYALKAEHIINNTDDENWKTRIYGFLATQFRISKLFTPAKEYTEKAMATAEKINNPEAANTVKGLIFQEKAYHEMAHKCYQEAIVYVQQSKQYFKKIQQHKIFFEMENEQLLGLNNYFLGNEEKAFTHYHTGLKLSEHLPENHITALIHNGLANVYLNKNDLLKVKKHLDIAQRITASSHDLQLKREINESAYQYYSKTNDIGNMLMVKNMQDSILTEIYRKSADFVDNSYTTLQHDKENTKQKLRSKKIFTLLIILVLLPIIPYLILLQKKQKIRRNQEEVKQIVQERYVKHSPVSEKQVAPEISSEITPSINHAIISPQSVSKILERLKTFENQKLYIQNDISLSYLATYCDTNAKYLSVVINSYKKKDFFNYINELRVNYIVKKLKNDPYYRRLKVAALAYEAGFSSQSKFALNFKKVTSLSPSEFIKSLTDE